MDTIHDLGGRQGHGPIPVSEGDAGFRHDWERRMWALARVGIATGITIDWFRHCLERMVPRDYLTYSYFHKWATGYMAMLIDNGQFTMGEMIVGHTARADTKPPARTCAELLQHNRTMCVDFGRPADQSPRFALGNRVRTHRHGARGHTRLPAYARGAKGKVIAHHGAHLLADRGALGEHVAEHLYTVAFTARELWGPEANPRDSVMLELWESYLV